MCHAVDDVVNAELIRFVGFVDRLESRVRPFPVFRDVGVVVHHHHHPLIRIVALEDRPERRCAAIVILRDDVETVDLEEGVENRLRCVELDEPPFRQHALYLLLEIVPVVAAAEVVEDHEATLQQVRTKVGRLLVRHEPAARLGHVGERILEQVRIVERKDVALLRVRRQIADLVHDLHEVPLAGRVVVRPCGALGLERDRRTVSQPDERELSVVAGVRFDWCAAATAESAKSAEAAARLRSDSRKSAAASLPWLPSSSAACSVMMSPCCSYDLATLVRAYSKASKTDTRPLRSLSAALSSNASTKYDGKRVSFLS